MMVIKIVKNTLYGKEVEKYIYDKIIKQMLNENVLYNRIKKKKKKNNNVYVLYCHHLAIETKTQCTYFFKYFFYM